MDHFGNFFILEPTISQDTNENDIVNIAVSKGNQPLFSNEYYGVTQDFQAQGIDRGRKTVSMTLSVL